MALIHGPAETGYVRLSEPMVNIRAALERAVAEQIIDGALRDTLVAAAKATFYQERSWNSVLAAIGDRPHARPPFSLARAAQMRSET